jgi:hypothetical protein
LPTGGFNKCRLLSIQAFKLKGFCIAMIFRIRDIKWV